MLDHLRLLLKELGDPQEKLNIVHVAGTNGKGTTCTYLASAFRESGYRTGLFTSPFVVEFRERFQIDGAMISTEDLCRLTEKTDQAAKKSGCELTEFEFITALAFCWFVEQHCDVVVLEAGLGGGTDSTNVIRHPVLSVITSISLDHTAILGDTIEKIAAEKAGILKENGTLALYPDLSPEARSVILDRAEQKNVSVLPCKKEEARILETGLRGTLFTFRGKEYQIGFSGIHQVYNALTAITALEYLKGRFPKLTENTILSGIQKAAIPGRMEIMSEHPLVLIDGGHNPGCAEALRSMLLQNLPGRRITAVIGMMSDKDSMTYLKDVTGLFQQIIAVKPDGPRGLPAEELAKEAEQLRPRESSQSIYTADSVRQGLELALSSSAENDVIVVCGSFIVAGEARKYFA